MLYEDPRRFPVKHTGVGAAGEIVFHMEVNEPPNAKYDRLNALFLEQAVDAVLVLGSSEVIQPSVTNKTGFDYRVGTLSVFDKALLEAAYDTSILSGIHRDEAVSTISCLIHQRLDAVGGVAKKD